MRHLVKLQAMRGDIYHDLTCFVHEYVEVQVAVTEKAAKDLKERWAIEKPKIEKDRVLRQKLIPEKVDLTDGELLAAWLKLELAKITKGQAKKKMYISFDIGRERTVTIASSEGKQKEMDGIAHQILSCGCAGELFISKGLTRALMKFPQTKEAVLPTGTTLRTGDTRSAANTHPFVPPEVKGLKQVNKIVSQSDTDSEVKRTAAKEAGYPLGSLLSNFLPMFLILYLYQCFGKEETENISQAGRKRVTKAWNDFKAINVLPEEGPYGSFLMRFKNFVFETEAMRTYPSDNPPKEWKAIFDHEVPSWARNVYERCYDLPFIIRGIQLGTITEVNVENFLPLDEDFFKSFCGVKNLKPQLRDIEVNDNNKKFFWDIFVYDKEEKKPLSEKQRTRIAPTVALLLKTAFAEMSKLLKMGAYTVTNIRALEKFKSTNMMVQKINRLNTAEGIQSINIGNFSKFPSLKAPIRNWLKSSLVEGETIEERFKRLNKKLSDEEIKKLHQKVSNKARGKDNSAGGRSAKGKNSTKGKSDPPAGAPQKGEKGDADKTGKTPFGFCRDFLATGKCQRIARGQPCRFKHQHPKRAADAASVPAPLEPVVPQQQAAQFSNEQLLAAISRLLAGQQGVPMGGMPQRPSPWGPAPATGYYPYPPIY
jgi:hypothetical protein